MIRKIPLAEVPRANIPGVSLYPALEEWEPLVEIICHGIKPRDAYEIELSEESRALIQSKNPATQFALAFRKRISPKQWQYLMFCRRGKIYVQAARNGKAAKK